MKLHVQILLVNLSSILNIIRKPMVWSFRENEDLHFDTEEDIHMSSKFYEEIRYMRNLDFANHLALISWLVSYKK